MVSPEAAPARPKSCPKSVAGGGSPSEQIPEPSSAQMSTLVDPIDEGDGTGEPVDDEAEDRGTWGHGGHDGHEWLAGGAGCWWSTAVLWVGLYGLGY